MIALTHRRRRVTPPYRGRVLGAVNAARGVAALAFIGLTSWFGGAVGILPVLVFQGVGYVVAACSCCSNESTTPGSPKPARACSARGYRRLSEGKWGTRP